MLIDAIATLARNGHPVTATIVGEGPDRAAFEAAVTQRGLGDAVTFVGAMPARAAFALGRLLVVPSRAESLPYIVLEAAAAGLPMVATRVGGIPEIFGADAGELVPPADAAALARAIAVLAATIRQNDAKQPLRLRNAGARGILDRRDDRCGACGLSRSINVNALVKASIFTITPKHSLKSFALTSRS